MDENGTDLVIKASYPNTREGGLVWEPALNGRMPISDWPDLDSVLRAWKPRRAQGKQRECIAKFAASVPAVAIDGRHTVFVDSSLSDRRPSRRAA